MRAVRIDGDSRPIGAPDNWSEETHGTCQALFVREEVVEGLRFMRSAWEVSADEAGWLLAGANVQLGISAPQHPVVNMGVGPTPNEALPVYTIRQITSARGQRSVRVTMFAPRVGLLIKTGGTVWAEADIEEDGFEGAVQRALAAIAMIATEKGIA